MTKSITEDPAAITGGAAGPNADRVNMSATVTLGLIGRIALCCSASCWPR